MILKNISFMSENFTSDNIENNENNPNGEDYYYDKLITRLKAIKKTIALLEKIIFK